MAATACAHKTNKHLSFKMDRTSFPKAVLLPWLSRYRQQMLVMKTHSDIVNILLRQLPHRVP